jgi:hypothetical protein
MIRIVLAFLILSVLIHFGIMGWQKMSGSDKWSLTKSVTYSIIVALLAIVGMIVLVALF